MHNPLSMTGRTVLIAGASAGLGRATAVALSRLGARVALVARREEVLREVQGSLAGGGHGVYPYDLMDTAGIPALLDTIARDMGPLWGLVHCAAIQLTKSIRFLKTNEFASVMTLGVESALALVEALQRDGVRHAEGGSVVLLSSVSGSTGQPGFAVYCASKGAVESITRSLARELASRRIRVNSVAPAQVLTESLDALKQSLTDKQFDEFRARHPLGFGEPEDVAHAVAFLLSDSSRWITGTNLVIDGGYLAQ